MKTNFSLLFVTLMATMAMAAPIQDPASLVARNAEAAAPFGWAAKLSNGLGKLERLGGKFKSIFSRDEGAHDPAYLVARDAEALAPIFWGNKFRNGLERLQRLGSKLNGLFSKGKGV